MSATKENGTCRNCNDADVALTQCPCGIDPCPADGLVCLRCSRLIARSVRDGVVELYEYALRCRRCGHFLLPHDVEGHEKWHASNPPLHEDTKSGHDLRAIEESEER